MSEFKPGDKVLVEATVNMQCKQHVSLYQQCGIPNYAWHVPISSIHRAEELERLRAYVELMPCQCDHVKSGAVTVCLRCRALGKEKS